MQLTPLHTSRLLKNQEQNLNLNSQGSAFSFTTVKGLHAMASFFIYSNSLKTSQYLMSGSKYFTVYMFPKKFMPHRLRVQPVPNHTHPSCLPHNLLLPLHHALWEKGSITLEVSVDLQFPLCIKVTVTGHRRPQVQPALTSALQSRPLICIPTGHCLRSGPPSSKTTISSSLP